ncbi:serine hydrolase domain-containing protein [Pseudemcibacter aquimaris]|uniref:serine hydrolase domain-containing protein n=1 Tax=Pseudemcibacter aquimaris TaxID=2857064 RepID=UPI0020122B76|nr:serine hydrolase domain-containing protein [Pseudemcibacter aquimaris]MCC3859660.1 beta-lactamase family protein [Pseudemcibacter aquimaris]WDU60055.1 beta-lactamase family protein [Pseudemcibacter aquimaris]
MKPILILKKHPIKSISLFIALILMWFLSPFYMYAAYNGFLPMPPSLHFEIPENAPKMEKFSNEITAELGENWIDLLEEHRQSINAPSLSASIFHKNEVIWSGATGWADVEAEIPATPNTKYRIGSTAKAITSAGLARLVDEGIIQLDAPISKYMKNLPNPDWENITPRQLASHMAGLPGYSDNGDLIGLYKSTSLSTRYEDVIEALEIFDGSDLMFEPGTNFHYTTFSTVLLSAVMQSATNKPYLDVMKTQVFSELEMHNTEAEYAISSKNKAKFYWNNDGASNQVTEWGDVDLSHRLAGGGFLSTSTDLVRLAGGFMNGDFIQEKTRNTFWTPQKLPNGEVNNEKYALGWRVYNAVHDDLNGTIGINHGGISRGAQSWLVIYPEHDLAIAVNINSKTDEFWDFRKIAEQLAADVVNQ